MKSFEKYNSLILLVFFLAAGFLCNSQNVDSLKQAFKMASNDTARVVICEQLSQTSDLRVIREYAWMEYEICRKNLTEGNQMRDFYSNYFALAHNNIGFYFENAGQTDSAILHFEEYKKISEKEGRLAHLATALNNLGVILKNKGDLDKALEYYRVAYNVSVKANDRQSIAFSLMNLGATFKRKREFDSALVCYQKAVNIEEAGDDKKTTAQALMALGTHYVSMSRNREAVECFNKSLRLSTEIRDDGEMAAAFGNIGAVYFRQGDLQRALEYFLEALKINEKLKDKFGMGASYNNIGTIYKNLGFADKALEFLTKAGDIQMKIHDMTGAANTYYNLGSIYYKYGDPGIKNDIAASFRSGIPKALDFFEKGLKISEKENDLFGIANGYKHLGNIFSLKINGIIDMTDHQKALENYTKSLQGFESLNDKMGVATVLTNLAKILFANGEFALAKEKGEKGLALAKELGYPEVIRGSSEFMSNLYSHSGDYRKALEMHFLYTQMSDSVNSEASRKSSLQKSFQYEYDKKVAADSIKAVEEKKSHAAKIEVEKTKRFSLYGGILLTALFAIFILYRFRITQRQKAIIESQKQEVDTAYQQLHERNKEILDSIRYAKRIQDSFLPNEKYIGAVFRRKK